jgi:predicted RNase H-like HicB family nuclease
MRNIREIAWRAQASWKRFTSTFKDRWTLDDYPIRVRFQKPAASPDASRRKLIPWFADVISWPAISGHGETREEAIAALRSRFEEFVASGESLPRPGTRVPFKIAPSDRVSQHPDLAKDFTERVLNLDWVFITDKSSLWDFHSDETNDKCVDAIRRVYGVDVSDITSANLADIFDRIEEQGPRR